MNEKKLWSLALSLAIITVGYNLIEGVVSIIFGVTDETLSLFGFGLDSFIEVVSGIGVAHMILRIRRMRDGSCGPARDGFEKTALKITGAAFYVLAAGLVLTVVYNVYLGRKPTTTIWGIIVAAVSMITMTVLMVLKIKAGRALNSPAIIADAHCTKTCLYLSCILLISSILYEVFKIGYFDSVGAGLIAWYSFKEGREAFEKSRGRPCGDCKE